MTDQLQNNLRQPIAHLVAILAPLNDFERMEAIRRLGHGLNHALLGQDTRPTPHERMLAQAAILAGYNSIALDLTVELTNDLPPEY